MEREGAAAASLVASMEAGWLHPAPVWSNMLTFDARPWRGAVHILASGDPCQDNSVAGKRAGKGGSRFLAPEVCRLAEECRPDIIFRENVPGNADGQLEAIVPALERLGYIVAAGIFSSAATRNTMRRERLFIMACAGDERRQQDCRSASRDERWAAKDDHEPSSLCPAMGGAIGRGNGRVSPHARRGSVERVASDGAGCGCEQALVESEGIGPGEGWSEHEGKQGRCALAGASSELGGADDSGRQRISRSREGGTSQPSTIFPPAVIPGPTDSRWIDVLDRFPELQPALSEEEAQSHLRRGIDAVAHRVERLRATGNGVDPMVGAYAFLSLSARLGV